MTVHARAQTAEADSGHRARDARPVDSHSRPHRRVARAGRKEETVATTHLRRSSTPLDATYRNLSTAELYEHAIRMRP